MAKKVAGKVMKTKDLEQAAIDFKDFIERVQKEYPNAEVSVIVKA